MIWTINVQNIHLGQQRTKKLKTKCLGKKVCKVKLRIDMHCMENPFENLITNKMTVQLNVLSSFMEYGVCCNVKGCLAITIKKRRLRMTNVKISKQSPKPCKFTTSSSHSSDRDTVCCFLDFQEMRESPRNTQKPVVDLLESRQPAQSLSQNALS
jgi:hypothetical protein